ncbi:MAG: NADH-ubiquinone oxidoreductase-F iron-sulfur binding region domain-containing protein [Myxococcota bacterium]
MRRPSTSALLELARRRADGEHAGNAVSDLAEGIAPDEVARRRGLPPAALAGVRSFYELLDGGTRVCDGTSCHFGGSAALRAEAPGAGTVRCLGMCHDPPGVMVGDAVYAGVRTMSQVEGPPDLLLRPDARRPVPRLSLCGAPVLLRNAIGPGDPASEYDLPGGDAILAAVEASGLRGRGGAAYPTAAKWRAARDTPAPERWVVANGDEGDPGSFADRVLLEDDPHAVLAGMVACARAIGARRGVVYVRAEYPRARLSVRLALAEARAAGWLGDLDVEVSTGAGSYVVGEETALLRSIEGLRGEPSPKPPYPAQSGLFGLPTVVQNVETLAAVPWVVRHGRPSGTKLVSVAGAVLRPGLVEAPFGTPLARILEEGAGGPAPGRRWKMALVGGPMGRVVPAGAFDVPLSYEALPGMGHAGVVVLDDTVTPRALARHLFDFARAESCGACVPCRVGTTRLAAAGDRAALERLLDTLEIGSRCGFGAGVPRPVRDLLAHYGDEVLGC